MCMSVSRSVLEYVFKKKSSTRPTHTRPVKSEDIVKERTGVGRSGCSVGEGIERRRLAKRRHDGSLPVRGYP